LSLFAVLRTRLKCYFNQIHVSFLLALVAMIRGHSVELEDDKRFSEYDSNDWVKLRTAQAMYTYNVVARLCNHSCHGNATIHSLCTAEPHVAVNNIHLFNVAVEKKQQWVPFALLSRDQIFCTAVNNISVLRSACKLPDIIVRF